MLIKQAPKFDSETEEILHLCAHDTKMFAKVFFPDRFFREFSAPHDEIFHLLDDDSVQKLAIAAPRGCGKTSLINLAYAGKRLLFQDSKYTVPVSLSHASASEQSDNLKDALETNEMILKIFGPQKTTRWATDRWAMKNGGMVKPRGAGQQVRGMLYNNARPDLFLIDDIEDDESVMNKDRRDNLHNWLLSALLNTVDRGKNEWRAIFIGTVLHEDAGLVRLMEDPSWKHLRLELCGDDEKSNFPEIMNTDRVKALIEEHRQNGKLDVFYREYRNLSISTEDSDFKQEYFRYYEESELKTENVENIVIIDPAKTVKVASDFTGIAGVGIDTQSNKIYIRDIVEKKMHPDEIFEAAFTMCRKLGANILGVEVTSLNEFITYPLRNEIIRRGLPIQLVELKARGKKEERIASLVPFYRSGLIYHNKSIIGPLEAQLLAFPRARHDDVMDAVAYFIEMLDMGDKYFVGISDEESKKDVEKEYEDIGKEREMSSNWRAI